MAKQRLKQGIDEIVAERQQEIDGALNEIVDSVEKYFLISPFQFIETENAEPGGFLFNTPRGATPFNRFYKWNDVYMGKLFPDAHEAQRKLEERGDHEDEPGELAFAAQRFGFLVGVLVGMKAKGATKEELLKRSEGFTFPLIQWERYRAKSAAEKAEVNRG